MVKFGLRLAENRSSDYPSDAYLDYDKLKKIINELEIQNAFEITQ